ncbi:Prophage CP4-57 regulatory protein (AlpA) [compost metagenome]
MTFGLDGAPVETGGREDRLLPWVKVRAIAGISRTTAWRMQQTGDFPAPVPVSPGRVAWWESELTAWKAARRLARPLAPPSKPRSPGRLTRALERSTFSPRPLLEPLPPPIVKTALRAPGRKRDARAAPDQLKFDF